ncbi:hypothetical protein B178_09261 [Corynebacterium diphtheriae DSM 43988]|nr:hypothetical protein B178_09261 [Corynebacterium diphtheriae DSM 43988]
MTPEQLLESDEELRAIAGVLNEQEEATLAMHLRGYHIRRLLKR